MLNSILVRINNELTSLKIINTDEQKMTSLLSKVEIAAIIKLK